MTRETVIVVLRDLVGVTGAGLVSFGAWQVFPPAGFIVGGTLLIIGAWMHGRGTAVEVAATDDEA